MDGEDGEKEKGQEDEKEVVQVQWLVRKKLMSQNRKKKVKGVEESGGDLEADLTLM